MRNYAGMCQGICSCNEVYKFLIQILPLKSSVFVVHFPNAFWHGNEAFPKVSCQNETVPLFVIFRLPYSKYSGVKICFYSCCYQNQNFSLVSYSCRSCLTRISLVSLVSHSSRIRVARVALASLMSGTRVVNSTRSKQTIAVYILRNISRSKGNQK